MPAILSSSYFVVGKNESRSKRVGVPLETLNVSDCS